ncbi:MAG TPA: hypothetical protein PL033_16585 [Candidatus Brocadiia bacterium]|nr:hypothetical protein [Candidatus Brocadiia bacterium]
MYRTSQRTLLTVVLSTLAAPATVFSAGDPVIEKPWFERHIVGMEIGPTGAQFGYSDKDDARYCSRFDGREIARRAAAAHSEYLVLWARDGDYAYYDSKLLLKAPGLAGRDPLKDVVDEARKLGLPLIAYCVVQQGGHFLAAHPEWEMRGSDGKPIGRFCYNSGYLEAMKAITAEQLAYGIDGFHVDMLDQGFGPPYGCWCDSCRALFEKEFGHPMPPGATWDAAWDDMLEFRYRTSERFEKELYKHIKTINPKATVDYNYHGNPPFSFEVGQRPVQHAGNSDFVTGETGAWGFSALTVGLNAKFYRAATPGLPYQIAIQRGVRMYHDQTTRPINDIRWELFTLLAHGAFVTMVDKTGFDGSLDPVAYERIGAAFAEAKAKRDHFGQAPVFEAGLYFSSRTRDWRGRENAAGYFQSFQGMHKACVMEHIPFGVLLDENLNPKALRQFKVVCLPNAAILSDREIALFRNYVAEGGNLIITGQSGQFDRMGNPLDASSLGELIGAKLSVRLDSQDNWARFPSAQKSSTAAQLAPDGRMDWAFLVKGPASVYDPTIATPLGELMKPWRTVRQQQGREGTEWPMSAEAPVGPAVLLNRIGAGKVLTFACSPDFSAAGEHAIIESRKLIRNAVRLLVPKPRVEVTAPANVEAVVTDDPVERILRVHFIAYNSTPQTTPARERPYVLPGLIEDAPIYRAVIASRDALKGVTALNSSTEFARADNRVELMISDIHEVVVLNY